MRDISKVNPNSTIYTSKTISFANILAGPCWLKNKHNCDMTIKILSHYDLYTSKHGTNSDTIMKRYKYLLEEVIGGFSIEQECVDDYVVDILETYDHYPFEYDISKHINYNNFFMDKSPIFFDFQKCKTNISWVGGGDDVVVFKNKSMEELKKDHTDKRINDYFYGNGKIVDNWETLDFISIDYDTNIEKIVDSLIHCKHLVTYQGGPAYLGYYLDVPVITIGGTEERYNSKYFFSKNYKDVNEYIRCEH